MSADLQLLMAFMQPIKHLLEDDSINEIMGNPDGSWWYEQHGQMHHATAITFPADDLATNLEIIASKLGKRLDASSPLLNAQLPDGSRLAAVLSPIVRPFHSITIRKFSKKRFTIADLIALGTLSEETAAILHGAITAGATLLISGGTNSGKTTLLNALTDYIPEHERIVVIEDTRELRIVKANLLAAECQMDATASVVTFDDLLRASLRWRPDRIILGEVRGNEARTLLDSFNTGHGGSMATIHASSAVKALRRFGELAMRSHQQSTRDDIAAEIADSVSIVVQVQRLPEGRRVTEIIALRGYDRSSKTFQSDSLFSLAGSHAEFSTTSPDNSQGDCRHAHA